MHVEDQKERVESERTACEIIRLLTRLGLQRKWLCILLRPVIPVPDCLLGLWRCLIIMMVLPSQPGRFTFFVEFFSLREHP